MIELTHEWEPASVSCPRCPGCHLSSYARSTRALWRSCGACFCPASSFRVHRDERPVCAVSRDNTGAWTQGRPPQRDGDVSDVRGQLTSTGRRPGARGGALAHLPLACPALLLADALSACVFQFTARTFDRRHWLGSHEDVKGTVRCLCPQPCPGGLSLGSQPPVRTPVSLSSAHTSGQHSLLPPRPAAHAWACSAGPSARSRPLPGSRQRRGRQAISSPLCALPSAPDDLVSALSLCPRLL